MFSTKFLSVALLVSVVWAAPLQEKRQWTPPACTSPSSTPSTVLTNCANPWEFASIFADGPYSTGAQIESAYQAAGAAGQASFFINGNNYGCIYDYAQDISARIQAGYELALQDAVWKIAGVKLAMFLAPYASMNDTARAIIQTRGYTIVPFTLDSGDTTFALGNPDASLATISNFIQKNRGQSAIGLFNEPKVLTATKVVPGALSMLKNAGYKLVKVSECLGIQPYSAIGQPSQRDASWTCANKPAPGASQ